MPRRGPRKTDDRLNARGRVDGVSRADVIDAAIEKVSKGNSRDRVRARAAIKNGHRKPRLTPEPEWTPDSRWIAERLELMFGPDDRLGGSGELEGFEARLKVFERELVLEDYARARDEADLRSQLELVKARSNSREAQIPVSGNLQRNQDSLFSHDPELESPETEKEAMTPGLDAERTAASPAVSDFWTGRRRSRRRRRRFSRTNSRRFRIRKRRRRRSRSDRRRGSPDS